NPAEDIMHIRYKTNMSKNAYRTIYTLDGKPVERKNIGQITEEDLDITSLKKGMYIMNIVDGTDRQRIKFIKK
ncbi:MAG: T9SS type A sorting domain-containing protein, partial [Candidatus Woesearchaeota archaeon]